MSQRWKEDRRTETWLEPWSWQGSREDEGPRGDEELFQKLTLAEPARRRQTLPEPGSKNSPQRKKPMAHTESCESDETEVEEVRPLQRPPGLPDHLVEGTRIREPMLWYQTGVTAKARSHLHPRCKQMKDTRPCGDIQREKQRRAERPEAPLNPELECGAKETQSCKHRGGRGGILPRDPSPRGRVAFP